MFGFLGPSKRKEYEKLIYNLNLKYNDLLMEKNRNTRELNTLIDIINNKGGDKFLREGVIPKAGTSSSGLTLEEVKSMLALCHPDKHDGKPSATRITQRLLQIRATLGKS